MKINKYSKKTKIAMTLSGILFGGVILSACGNNAQTNAFTNDQNNSAQALVQLQKAQPTPVFKYSQLRETLIEIESAQANTTQTTTFFFNQGVADPTFSCPSIGFPLASTTELTNPDQIVNSHSNQSVISQSDPTGVYAGASTGTYVVCVANNGTTYLDYWEGFVQTVSGPAVWSNGGIHVTGPSTVTIKSKP
jgi:hypothetical protein